MAGAANNTRDFSAELLAARNAKDWAAHERIWEERRLAWIEVEEADLAASVEADAVSEAKASFERVIAAIEHGGLRERVRDSAYCNSFADEAHREYPNDLARWEVATRTAEMIVDDPRGFYGSDCPLPPEAEESSSDEEEGDALYLHETACESGWLRRTEYSPEAYDEMAREDWRCDATLRVA